MYVTWDIAVVLSIVLVNCEMNCVKKLLQQLPMVTDNGIVSWKHCRACVLINSHLGAKMF